MFWRNTLWNQLQLTACWNARISWSYWTTLYYFKVKYLVLYNKITLSVKSLRVKMISSVKPYSRGQMRPLRCFIFLPLCNQNISHLISIKLTCHFNGQNYTAGFDNHLDHFWTLMSYDPFTNKSQRCPLSVFKTPLTMLSVFDYVWLWTNSPRSI